MFTNKYFPNRDHFTPSRMVWMVTFCKSGLGRMQGRQGFLLGYKRDDGNAILNM